MLFLALSCLQSRRQGDAFAELARYPIGGLQLTPGCLPTPGFAETVRASDKAIRFHHGFAWDAYRRPVYDDAWRPLALEELHSVHPPSVTTPRERMPASGATGATARRARRRDIEPGRGRNSLAASLAWLQVAREERLLVETMYPGEILGTGDEIDRALDLGLRLAVDVSHLHIQRHLGTLDDRQLARLLESDLIEEIHVSDNNGRRDQHRNLSRESYLLDWVRERSAGEMPIVLESYWHRTPESERMAQIELLTAR